MQELVEKLSVGMACEETNEILRDMTNIVLQISVNPLGLPVYAEELGVLSNELRAVNSVNDSLNADIELLANSVDSILSVADTPSPADLLEVPQSIAEIQVSLKGLEETCSALTRV